MQGLLATAQNLENAGKWAEASAVYKTITEKNPADAMAWIDLGNTLASQGKLEEALVAYMKAVEMPGTSTAIIRIGMYNAACAYALLGDKDKAFKWLKKAAEAGYKNAAQVERDTDLDSLRDDPRYKEIIALMKG